MTNETDTGGTDNTFTKADKYRRQLSNAMSAAMRALHVAEREFEALKEEAKEAKASVEVAQARVNRIADELRDVELGQYQPTLNYEKNHEHEDAAQSTREPHSIDVLVKHGLTENQVEKLRESELEIDTVEKLERCIADDAWWYKKVKGFGEKNIDRLSDALVAFREQNPILFFDTGHSPLAAEEVVEDAKTKLA